jgi:hypothetical protein
MKMPVATMIRSRAGLQTVLRSAWPAAALAVAVALQPVGVAAQTAPAATPRAAPKPAVPATAGSRTRIELPPAERQALEDNRVTPAAPARNELLPQADDANGTLLEPPATVVDEIRTGNRVSEIRVTPALGGHTYTINNREGRQPITATGSPNSLSLPKFFTFEFGQPTERAVAPAAPPPPSTQSR